MSWFTTLVLIPPDTPEDGVLDAVAALLAPFDSNRTVAPYTEPCFCVETDSLSRPDPACPECGGTGQIHTTVNPRGYWESWRIGGGTCEDWLGPTHAMRAGDAADADKIPFALVTPDGAWYGGWHSLFKGAAWEVEALRLLRHYADAIAVACTLHD
ncbi:hypothetical protein [Sulfobacillus harzensis]|uniref:Uncharacterized protein n=1 Tax=Sulfobacillus harzensis TaxID=2729629 RepID=A0A7Y0L7I7_9FIRM|nr:hypothetical protein [Sulfobacillus harzensis]NMP24397.1 hypothetical protein [Sulfobacillus harzensis]